MNQPLGRMCGNAIEVDESLETLQGQGPKDLTDLTLRLSAELLKMTGLATDVQEATQRLRGELMNGRAMAKFEEMVAAQGGSLAAPRPRAPEALVVAAHSGYVASIQTEALGWAVIQMGGGRRKITDPIDHSVGLEMRKRIGDYVQAGEPLVRLFVHANQREVIKKAVEEAISIQEQPVMPPALIVETN